MTISILLGNCADAMLRYVKDTIDEQRTETDWHSQ